MRRCKNWLDESGMDSLRLASSRFRLRRIQSKEDGIQSRPRPVGRSRFRPRRGFLGRKRSATIEDYPNRRRGLRSPLADFVWKCKVIDSIQKCCPNSDVLTYYIHTLPRGNRLRNIWCMSSIKAYQKAQQKNSLFFISTSPDKARK